MSDEKNLVVAFDRGKEPRTKYPRHIFRGILEHLLELDDRGELRCMVVSAEAEYPDGKTHLLSKFLSHGDDGFRMIAMAELLKMDIHAAMDDNTPIDPEDN